MYLRANARMYSPPPSEYVPTYDSVRKSRVVPVYDSKGKVISERTEEYIERVVVRDDPNKGLDYRDFDVENAQRLGIVLQHVPTGGNPLTFDQKQHAVEYLDSPELEAVLLGGDNNNSKSE